MDDRKLQKLDKMLGQSWLFRTKEFHFLNYRIGDDGSITLATKQKWFDFANSEEVSSFLKECLPMISNELTISAPKDDYGLTRANSQSPNMMAYLKGLLVEDIERVREDPAYVEQAKTSSNNVKRLIDLTKLEMQMNQVNQKKAII